jgi:TetR/AcrR family transcriptional regulator, acrAB operon repressor
MARRTKEEALATRHRILDAAEALFERQGVSRTSLNDIAAAAEVTRGAVYWHFKDKADLFNAMMERAIMPMEESLHCGGACPVTDPLDFLLQKSLHALKLTATDAQMRRVLEISMHKVEYVDELVAVRDRQLQGRDECLAECERAFKAAMKAGLLETRLPARSAALGLHALIDGLARNWLLDPEAFDLTKVGRQVITSYVDGLKPQPAASAASGRSAAAAAAALR